MFAVRAQDKSVQAITCLNFILFKLYISDFKPVGDYRVSTGETTDHEQDMVMDR